jgi:hypothetical protein
MAVISVTPASRVTAPGIAKERVTHLASWVVASPASEGQQVTRLDRVPVAVVLEISGCDRIGVPRCDELDQQPDCSRRQNAVRPYHLGPAARRAISARLFGDPRVSDDSHAPQSEMSRQGKDHLAANDKAIVERMHVHADVDVCDQKPACEPLQLVALAV